MKTTQKYTPEIKLNADEVLMAMGIRPGSNIKKRVSRYVSEVMELVALHARPVILLNEMEPDIGVGYFGDSRRFLRYENGSSLIALMAGTAGREWDSFITQQEDPMLGYICNAAAVALARHTVHHARLKLSQKFPAMQIGSALSPGNDGLPLNCQKTVSEILDLESAGITMDMETYAMTPAASVTAIYSIGNVVESSNNPACDDCPKALCSDCPSKNCTLRVAETNKTAA